MAELADTIAQLSTSVTLWALKGGLDPADFDDVSSQLDLAKSFVPIGAVIEFSEDNPRPTTPRYEIDASKAGEMVERTPGLEDHTMTLQRVVLYEADMLEAFGFEDAQSIIDQNIPFIMIKVERSPANSTIPTRTTTYEGCWFHNLPKSYSITGDLRVMQNVEVGFTKKTRK